MAEVRIHAGADADYCEAYIWYYRQSEEAAGRFEAEFQEALDRIRRHPANWAVYDATRWFVTLKKFPFHVIFRLKGEVIWVVALAHGSRDPDYWRGR